MQSLKRSYDTCVPTLGRHCFHRSTAKEATEIVAETDNRGLHFVRTYTAGQLSYEETWSTETRARERFERVVEEHYES
jgi:hypothetical protein